ncbi:MAG: ABC transporter permease [Acetobacteraceae bacterium]|nr:ABC transporter permease [Acetobacteraceae bacterium]
MTPSAWLGAAVLAVLLVLVLAGPVLAPYDPTAFHAASRLQGPSPAFPLGTDQFGRDLLSRILHGAPATVGFGLGAATLGAAGGAVLGITSAYLGGWVDTLAMRATDALISVPELLLALIIVTVLGRSGLHAMLAVALAFLPGMARVARSATLSVRTSDYVLHARATGESVPWIVGRELLPNVAGPILVEATIRVAFAVMLGATLSFLGLGAQPPSSEWGLMIAEARQYMFRNPWMVAAPGAAIALVAIGFNLGGDALRDRLNPGLR